MFLTVGAGGGHFLSAIDGIVREDVLAGFVHKVCTKSDKMKHAVKIILFGVFTNFPT